MRSGILDRKSSEGFCSSSLYFLSHTESKPKELLTIYDFVNNPQVSRDQQGRSRASGSSSAVQEDETGQRESDRHLSEVIFSSLPSFFPFHQFPSFAQRGKGEKKESRENGTEAEGACALSVKGPNSVDKKQGQNVSTMPSQAVSQHLPPSCSVLPAGLNVKMRAHERTHPSYVYCQQCYS